jgi:hypothetical protein
MPRKAHFCTRPPGQEGRQGRNPQAAQVCWSAPSETVRAAAYPAYLQREVLTAMAAVCLDANMVSSARTAATGELEAREGDDTSPKSNIDIGDDSAPIAAVAQPSAATNTTAAAKPEHTPICLATCSPTEAPSRDALRSSRLHLSQQARRDPTRPAGRGTWSDGNPAINRQVGWLQA